MAPTIGAHPRRLDLVTRAGQPVDFSVPVLDAAGAPVPSLIGWAAAAQIRAGDTPTAGLLHQLDVSLEGGSARVRATGTQTAAWGWSSGRWDLVLIDPDGDRSPLVAGWCRHYPTVTRED